MRRLVKGLASMSMVFFLGACAQPDASESAPNGPVDQHLKYGTGEVRIVTIDNTRCALYSIPQGVSIDCDWSE